MLVSVALFAATTLLAKAVGTGEFGAELHPLQISAGRFCFAFLAIALITLFKPIPLRGAQWSLNAARSLFGWLGISLFFAATLYIPLADANAISFISIVFAMFLAVIFLHEKVGTRRWSAAVLALIGAVVVAQPGSSTFQPASLIAFAAAVFIGTEIILIKLLSGRDKPQRILLINNACGCILAILTLPFVWITPNTQQWFALAAIGVVMMVAQYLNILAMQRSDASFVAPFWYTAPVFAALYDFMLFGQGISLSSIIGIAMIMTGGVIISYRENIRRPMKGHQQ